jgi:putative ubiquitin-RnfH superfamily antitoxin RatB of RatAB toxin-antitoxin module
MAPAEGQAAIRVEVAYCPGPGVNDVVVLSLPAGATVADALRESGVVERHGLAWDGLRVGVWCKARELSTPLREGDRVELYRPLTVDPKEARRLRYRRHKDRVAADG